MDGTPIEGVDRARAQWIAEQAGTTPTSPREWIQVQLSNLGLWMYGDTVDASSVEAAEAMALATALTWQRPAQATPADDLRPGNRDTWSYADFDELDVPCEACGARAGQSCAPNCTSGSGSA